MTQTTVRVQLQQRVSTDSEWSSANPVLLLGEVGHNSTNKQYKLGDGSTQWNSLAYAGASVPTTITVADESTDTSCNVAFFTGATGDLAPKTGTNLTFNSNTGALTATSFVGALTGNADTATTSTNANHVSVADNESTDENNLIPFIEDASATGNVGLESDGDFHYNPSTGKVTATAFVDGKGSVRSIPQNSQSSGYTIVAADAGKHIYISTGGVTFAAGICSVGDALTIINNSASDQTITCSAVTMYLAGDTSAKTSLTLKGRGMATFLCTASNVYYGSGGGLE
mgnify:CR=1 FL=1|tara:strand:- start:569 stop:1423 length:855 start_codon:yes stop_codon:yes gene_type:complete